MTERPILFRAEMVRAILAGHKTQTRRLIRNPGRLDGFMLAGEEPDWCPYGRPGSRLWVRETWGLADHGRLVDPCLNYRADGSLVAIHAVGNGVAEWTVHGRQISAEELIRIPDGWRPSIFMPRWASRLTLTIAEVRAERLQEITEADAKAEGVRSFAPRASSDRAVFRVGWDAMHGKTPAARWERNPWVWVVAFKVDLPLSRDAGCGPEGE